MQRKKSSKDIAFEKERIKFRQEIKNLQCVIKKNKKEYETMQQKISELEENIRQKDEWIDRLLEYMELSENEIKTILEKEKVESEITQVLKKMSGIFSEFGGF